MIVVGLYDTIGGDDDVVKVTYSLLFLEYLPFNGLYIIFSTVPFTTNILEGISLY